jgi:hypothetical protein
VYLVYDILPLLYKTSFVMLTSSEMTWILLNGMLYLTLLYSVRNERGYLVYGILHGEKLTFPVIKLKF